MGFVRGVACVINKMMGSKEGWIGNVVGLLSFDMSITVSKLL